MSHIDSLVPLRELGSISLLYHTLFYSERLYTRWDIYVVSNINRTMNYNIKKMATKMRR